MQHIPEDMLHAQATIPSPPTNAPPSMQQHACCTRPAPALTPHPVHYLQDVVQQLRALAPPPPAPLTEEQPAWGSEAWAPSSSADATRRIFCNRSLNMAHIKVCQQWPQGRSEPGIRITVRVMACTRPSHPWHLQIPADLCAWRVLSQAVHVQDCSGMAQELVALGICCASLVQAPHMTTVTPELGCWADVVAAGIAGHVVADAAEQGYCA